MEGSLRRLSPLRARRGLHRGGPLGQVALRLLEEQPGELGGELDRADAAKDGLARRALDREAHPARGLPPHDDDVRLRGSGDDEGGAVERKSTRLNSSHANISYAVF